MLTLMKLICLGITVAGVLSLPGGNRGMNCWPSNMTCLASLPPDAMPWPTERRDSYMTEDVEVMDLEEFTVSNVQKDPRDVCKYKVELVAAMKCLTDIVAAKCPFLPDEILLKSQRFKIGLDNFCAEINSTDVVCLHDHWKATMACHDVMGPKKRGDKGDDSYPPPSRDSKPMMDRQAWNKIICQKKYEMAECVKKKMVECHKKTAELMNQFMRDMASPQCAAMMKAWDQQAPPDGAGATSVTVAWATVLTSAFSLALLYRLWFG